MFRVRCMARNRKDEARGVRECGTRKSLSKRIEDYVRLPKCPRCGAQKWGADRHRRKELRKREKCWCEGYHFMHTKGSKLCVFHRDFYKHFED
jgi:hypothetical protein